MDVEISNSARVVWGEGKSYGDTPERREAIGSKPKLNNWGECDLRDPFSWFPARERPHLALSVGYEEVNVAVKGPSVLKCSHMLIWNKVGRKRGGSKAAAQRFEDW